MHPLKTVSPEEVTLLGIVMDFSVKQLRNAFVGIEVTVIATITDPEVPVAGQQDPAEKSQSAA